MIERNLGGLTRCITHVCVRNKRVRVVVGVLKVRFGVLD